MKKKTANGFKKKCISAGVGILIAASAGPSLTAPVYAAQAASEIPEDAAAPTVSDKHSPITQNPDWTAGGYTEFGVKEISNQERRVVIKVILKQVTQDYRYLEEHSVLKHGMHQPVRREK